MTFHPVYGRKLLQADKARLFGTDHTNDYRGIVQRSGKVAWIHVQTGAQQSYPNEVTSDCIKYCYSTKDGKANAAMKKAYQGKESFIVKVVPDKGADTFFWGMGRISVEQEDHMWRGRMYRRFVIIKADDVSDLQVEHPFQSPPPPQPSSQPSPQPHFASDESSDSQQPCQQQSPKTMQSTPTSSPCHKRARGSDLDELVACAGVDFDSLLEKRHAAMMSLLKLKWSRDAPTVPGIAMGNGRIVSYTPDFVVDIPYTNSYTQTYLVEIKPCYPYDDEIRKAMGAVEKLKVMPLFLFYNTEFTCPFAERWTGSGHGDYRHNAGIRALKFSWNAEANRVVIEHDAAYTLKILSDGAWIGGIDVRTTVGEVIFDNSQLHGIYHSVQQASSS